MKVIDCVLVVVVTLENISGTLGEDSYTGCNDDDYSGPEGGHEDGAASVFQDAD